MSENLYTAFGYMDEMEELDYGAEDVLPVIYDYQKRDIDAEFDIVESTDRVIVDESEIEKSLNDVPEDCFVAETVSANASVEPSVEKFITAESLYDDFANEPIQSFHNNHNNDDLDYIEEGDSFELPSDTDKREYNTENYEIFEDTPDRSEEMGGDVVENDRIGIDASITDEAIVEAAELTVEEQAKQIATTIQKYYKSYDYLSVENKAKLFNFRIDDNSYNLKLHAGVLKKLGIHMYGSDGFEDYQSIYEETMKRVEKQNSECERRYYNKEWEREKGR